MARLATTSLLCLLVFAHGCKEPPPPAKDAQVAVPEVSPKSEPRPCSEQIRLPSAESVQPFGPLVELGLDTYAIGEPKDKLKLGVLADGRDTVDRGLLRSARQVFAEQSVDVVVVLGGMSSQESELGAVVDELATGNIPLFLNVGNRENSELLRKLATAARRRGRLVFASSEGSLVSVHGHGVALLGGVTHASQLIQRDKGCLIGEDDARRTALALAQHPLPSLWLSYAAPAQVGPGSSDLGRDGAHAGSRVVGAAAAASTARAVVHAQVDDPLRQRRSGIHEERAQLFLASGSLDPLAHSLEPRPTGGASALLVEISSETVSWRRKALSSERQGDAQTE